MCSPMNSFQHMRGERVLPGAVPVDHQERPASPETQAPDLDAIAAAWKLAANLRPLAGISRGHTNHAMGTVSIGTQWLIVAAGIVLCPVFVLLTAYLTGWLLFRQLWARPAAIPCSADMPR